MGGNAVFNGHVADAIEIHSNESRTQWCDRLTRWMIEFQDRFYHWHLCPLFDEWAPVNEYVAGSFGFLFDSRISTEDLLRSKRFYGDIDLQIDQGYEGMVMFALKEYNNVPDLDEPTFELLGFNKTVDTIVTLWRDTVTGKNIQIDLELVEFDDYGRPNEWSRFSHSSSWNDAQLYIKGFAHKYIFRAITACDLVEAPVQLKTKQVRRMVTPLVFSPKGARTKYKFHSYQGDETVYYEVPSHESEYVRDVKGLFELFFTDDEAVSGNPETLEKMYSYTGVIELILEHVDPYEFQLIVDGMEHLLWGEHAQKLFRDSPSADFSHKRTVYSYLADKLGCDQAGWDEAKVDAYYANY